MADSRPAVATSTERAQAVLRRAGDRLGVIACRALRDPTEAQDATHARLQRLLRVDVGPSRFDQGRRAILVNTCRDRLRASRRQPRDISAEVEIATDDPYARSDLHETLTAGLATLSPEQRVVVALRYYLDLPIDQIADRLDIPAGTVQSRLHYALKRLHGAIDEADRKGAIR